MTNKTHTWDTEQIYSLQDAVSGPFPLEEAKRSAEVHAAKRAKVSAA